MKIESEGENWISLDYKNSNLNQGHQTVAEQIHFVDVYSRVWNSHPIDHMNNSKAES